MKSKKSNHELTRIDSNLGSNVSNQLHQREEDIFPSIEFPLYEEKSERWASERRWWNRSVPRETCKFNYKRGRRSNGSSDFGGVSSDEGKKPEAKKSHRRINTPPLFPWEKTSTTAKRWKQIFYHRAYLLAFEERGERDREVERERNFSSCWDNCWVKNVLFEKFCSPISLVRMERYFACLSRCVFFQDETNDVRWLFITKNLKLFYDGWLRTNKFTFFKYFYYFIEEEHHKNWKLAYHG